MGTMMSFSPVSSLTPAQPKKGLLAGRQQSPLVKSSVQRPTQRILVVRAQQEPQDSFKPKAKEILTQEDIDAVVLPTQEALKNLLEQVKVDEKVKESLAKVYEVIPEEATKTAVSSYAKTGKNTLDSALEISREAINEAANTKSPVNLVGTWWKTFTKMHSLALKTGLEHTGTSAKLINDVFKSKKAEAPAEAPKDDAPKGE